jgi:hypothetical protein
LPLLAGSPSCRTRQAQRAAWRGRPHRVARERWHIQSRESQSLAANSIVDGLGEHACQVYTSASNGKAQWKAEARNQFQEVALALRILFTTTPQVGVKGAAFQKIGQRRLIDQRTVVVSDRLQCSESLYQRRRQYDIALPQRREKRLAERADVNNPAILIQASKARLWRAGITELRIVIVFDNPRPGITGCSQKREPAAQRHAGAKWKLMRRGYVNQ